MEKIECPICGEITELVITPSPFILDYEFVCEKCGYHTEDLIELGYENENEKNEGSE